MSSFDEESSPYKVFFGRQTKTTILSLFLSLTSLFVHMKKKKNQSHLGSPLRSSSKLRSSPLSKLLRSSEPKSPVEKVHQEEVQKINELWEDTANEMERTAQKLTEIENRKRYEMERVLFSHILAFDRYFH
jgi:hypothetical protein